jgi:hypothetical protein
MQYISVVADSCQRMLLLSVPPALLLLLQLLAILGQADQTASEGMYEVLRDVIRRADTGINVGYAVRLRALVHMHTLKCRYEADAV